MYVEKNKIEVTDLGGGVSRRILAYDKNMMSVEVYFEEGAIGANHSHPHEQIGYVVSGKIKYHEEGLEDKILTAGDTYYVAPDVVHGVVALEPTVLLDIFTPHREDFLE